LKSSPANAFLQASACKQQMLEDATLGGDATHAEPPVDTTMTEVRARLGNSLQGTVPAFRT